MHPTHAARARVAVQDKDGDAAIELLSDMLDGETGPDDGASGDLAEGIAPTKVTPAGVSDPTVQKNGIDPAALAEGRRRLFGNRYDQAKEAEAVTDKVAAIVASAPVAADARELARRAAKSAVEREKLAAVQREIVPEIVRGDRTRIVK
jgi:hypothetical protein